METWLYIFVSSIYWPGYPFHWKITHVIPLQQPKSQKKSKLSSFVPWLPLNLWPLFIYWAFFPNRDYSKLYEKLTVYICFKYLLAWIPFSIERHTCHPTAATQEQPKSKVSSFCLVIAIRSLAPFNHPRVATQEKAKSKLRLTRFRWNAFHLNQISVVRLWFSRCGHLVIYYVDTSAGVQIW